MRRSLISFAALLAGLLCGAESPELIPIESFFATPALVAPRLSEDGSRVLMLVRGENGKRSIATFDFASSQARLVFCPNDYDVDYAIWKGDRIVFGGDAGGNESEAMRSIKADGSGLTDLSESYQEHRPLTGAVGGNLISSLQDEANNVLIFGYGAERDITGGITPTGELGVYRLDVRNGKRKLIEVSGEKCIELVVDGRTGAVYGRVRQIGAENIYELRLAGSRRYVEVARSSASETPWSVEGILADGKHAVIHHRDAAQHDRGALIEYDLETGKPSRVLFEPPAGEIERTLFSREGELVGVKYVDAYPHYHWFSPRWEQMYAGLSATFRGEFVEIVSRDRTDTRFIVVTFSDRNPGAYYLYDSAKTTLTPLGKVFPKIDPAQMAGRYPFTFKARDGLQIQGYLTIPVGREKQPNPLILLPHGGPFGIRDDWTFDPEAQLFASRGYTVMQVNYRGSGGYGAHFESVGKRQWGRAMQDDLTDAVDWAIAKKVTTADKVGIVGASYGGYAVLAGLVYTPDKYCFGVNYVGVADLRLQVGSTTKDKGRFFKEWAPDWIGSDPEDLKARSPIEFVERIKVPTLHAYGENDPRVDIEQWRRLERELKKYHKDYIFFREADEGHGFENESSRIRYYRAVMDFVRAGFSGEGQIGESKVLEMPVGTPVSE